MSAQQVTLSATYSCSSTPGVPPTQLASVQVTPSSANANIMHAYIPALSQLQADINTQLTASLHLDAESTANSNTNKKSAKIQQPDQDGDDQDEGEDEEVEDQEDDIDDKHTLPARVLGASYSRASAATNKRPRLD